MSAPLSNSNSSDPFVLRLLKALTKGRGHLDPVGGLEVEINVGGLRRVVRFDVATVSATLAKGLITDETGTVVLAADGCARLAASKVASSPFLAQHRPLRTAEIEVDGVAASVLVDEAESPLAWLRRRRGRDGSALIGEAAFQAGERLRSDFTRGSMSPRLTATWNAAMSGSGYRAGDQLSYSDLVVAARQRVASALAAVGPELSGVVLDVCCFLKGLEEVERDHGWPVRSAKVVLGLGLDRLARHYGYASEARGPDRGPLKAWSAPDARPVSRSR